MERYQNSICACIANMSFEISRLYGNAFIQVTAHSNKESVLVNMG